QSLRVRSHGQSPGKCQALLRRRAEGDHSRLHESATQRRLRSGRFPQGNRRQRLVRCVQDGLTSAAASNNGGLDVRWYGSSNESLPLKAQALRNISSSWFGLATNLVVGFFLSPFILHHLGDDAFGLWVLVFSLTGYYGLFDFGIRSSIVRYVAQYKATG